MYVLDADVGEAVALCLQDQTPFMEELRRIRPFRLMLKAGVGRNEFGPLCFMVFWIFSPADPGEAFAACGVSLNPHSGEQRDLFEFENTSNWTRRWTL